MLKISELLSARGEKQSDLARAALMAPGDVSMLVRGRMKPYPGQAAKMAAALDWEGDPMELFEEVEEER